MNNLNYHCLGSFDINVVNEVTSFEINHLPHPPVRQAILTNLEYPAIGQGRSTILPLHALRYADPAWRGVGVGNFTAHIPSMLLCDESIASYARVKTSRISHAELRCTR